MSWTTIARSAIGTRHQEQQLPCQDATAVRVLGEVAIGAVADGAGSAAYADVGAKLAVETTLQYLSQTEMWLQRRQFSWSTLPDFPPVDLLHRLFSKAVQRTRQTLHRQAQATDSALADFACTLLLFLATPHWLAAMQIGDGFIVVRSPHQSYQLLFQPDKGEFANQTSFVTSPDAIATLQVRLWADTPSFICAATDGVERVAIRFRDWTAFPPFFQPLEAYLEAASPPDPDENYLVDFLTSDRLNARTDDDKTLLLCHYQPSP
ncbi:PP2C family serine/threonine-protein phosphatase [Trichothermofontia sp.]